VRYLRNKLAGGLEHYPNTTKLRRLAVAPGTFGGDLEDQILATDTAACRVHDSLRRQRIR
jgi:hypothetical protein